MAFTKLRWSKVYESSEEELIDLLDSMGINAQRHSLEPNEEISLPPHSSETTIWCAEGSFQINIGAKVVSMQPGDYIIFPGESEEQKLTSGFAGSAYYIS